MLAGSTWTMLNLGLQPDGEQTALHFLPFVGALIGAVYARRVGAYVRLAIVEQREMEKMAAEREREDGVEMAAIEGGEKIEMSAIEQLLLGKDGKSPVPGVCDAQKVVRSRPARVQCAVSGCVCFRV